MRDYDILARAADRCDIVSVDLFDTIVLRDLSCERRRFDAIARLGSEKLTEAGWRLPSETLFRSRREVQLIAYRAQAVERPSGDVRLANILAVQAKLLGLPPRCVALLREAEVEWEARTLRGNVRLRDQLGELAQKGKRIIAISDTYHDAGTLWEILNAVLTHHPIATIYASADRDATKKAGSLYFDVVRSEGVAPHRIVHCGDDRHADLIMARQAGLQAVWLRRPRPAAAARKLDGLAFRLSHTDMHWEPA